MENILLSTHTNVVLSLPQNFDSNAGYFVVALNKLERTKMQAELLHLLA
jgi:hypothetical protein